MTLKRKVFLQALMLLLLCDVLSSGISFALSKQLITDQIIASKRNELRAVDDRIRDSYSVVQEKMDVLADETDFREIAAAVVAETSSYEKSAQIDRVLNRLSVELYNMRELFSLNVIAGRWVMSTGTTDSIGYAAGGTGIDKDGLDSAGAKARILPLLAKSHPGQTLLPEHIMISRISADVYLIGVLQYEEMISDKQALLHIGNRDGHMIYGQSGSDRGQEEPPESSFLTIAYMSPQSGLEYSLFLEEREIEAKFQKPLVTIVGLSLGVLVIFGVLLYVNTDKLLKPISSFSAILSKIEHVSQTAEIDSFIDKYRRKGGMRRRLYVYFSLGIVPLFIVIMANFIFFRDVVLQEAKTKDYGTIREIRSNIEYKMESYNILMKKLSLDSAIQREVLRLAGSGEPNKDIEELSDLIVRKGVLAQNIRYVRLYDDRLRLLYSSDNTASVEVDKAEWAQALSDPFNPYYWTLEKGGDSGSRNLILYGKIKFLPRPGREARAFQHIGYIEMSMKPFFDEKLNLSAERSNQMTYIVDNDNNVLYSSRPDEQEAEMSVKKWLGEADLGHAGPEFKEYALDGMTLVESAIGFSSWRIAFTITASAAGNIDRILIGSLTVVFLMLLLALTLSELLAKQILRPMQKLIRFMDGMETQKLKHLALNLGNNEFAHMALNFKNMLARLQSLSEDIKEKELERFELEKRKKEAQLTALQSQMNPHFLYNIFTSIHLLVRTKQNEKASEMIQTTGRLLRFGLYRGNQIISVAEELEHVGAYIRIQEIRYNSRVRVLHDREEGIESYRMPKFLLQPVVENAFEHASSQDRPLTLMIRLVTMGGERLVISVQDDGIGIREEKLASIRERLVHLTPSDHIGLLNVHERIQLFYGEPYGLDLQSEWGKGTTVTLVLPLTKEA